MTDQNNDTKTIKLQGVYPPIPTPFDNNGTVAEEALKKNLSFLNRFDLRGYVVLGSNGEFVLLSKDEKLQVLRTAREAIPMNKLLIAGTGCQSTRETIELTKGAAGIGADAALVLPPHYYKKLMTLEVLRTHFFAAADASPIPVLVYNMPACTGIDLDEDTIAALSEHHNIIGLKDSSGNVTKIGALNNRLEGFQILAGSGSFFLPALSVGAVGGIMALANIAPRECLTLHDHFLSGRTESARELQQKMIPVNAAVTSRWGVPALKAAMDFLGLYGGPVRSPLLPVSPEILTKLKEILNEGNITSQ
ncbi:MAG: dihydrodipicolinate synthase family protein [Candidatus Aminicenantes bacterium]|nr:dihydrodipicolinate synthase family protein [Candidatus Aminicenantes bacterium]